TFSNNTSTTKGGAIEIGYASATLSDCTFTGNSCSFGSKWIAGKGEERTAGTETLAGGAIALDHAKSQCSLSGCSFTGNKAPNGCGGAIIITTSGSPGPSLTIGAGNSFTDNTAFFHGGAIFAAHGFTLTGTSGSKVNFNGNQTLSTGSMTAAGGAIFMRPEKNYSISYAVFNGCEAGSESSSVCEYSNGGALAVRAVTSLTVANCEFTACRGRNGGCLDLEPGSSSTIAFNDCSFHDNICRSGALKNGTAGNFHGAVARIGGEGSVNFTSCTFEDNVAHHSGGVLHLNSETAVVNCSGCTFDDNSVSDTSSGYGGAISIEKGTLNMSGSCTVSDNTAKFAGALCIDDGTANLTASTFSGNSATNGSQSLVGEENTAGADNVAGGAILLRNSTSTCTLTACTLSGNSAPNGCGGAIGRLNTGGNRLRINLGTSFENNTAYFHGGAIFSMGNVEINSTDAAGEEISSAAARAAHVTFSGDYTSCPTNQVGNGGAVYLKGGTSHFNYAEFSANKAGYVSSTPHGFGGAVALSGNTTLRGCHCDFSSCRGRRGGVISMNNGAKSDLSDCRFYQNNTVDSWGSCIYMDTGEGAESLYLNRCIFESNTTTSRGVIAGSSNNRPYICYLNRVTFKNNTNTNESGSNYGVVYHFNGGVLCMNNCTCVGNASSNTDGNTSNYSFTGQSMLIVNSTFIDSVEGEICRVAARFDMSNNILINSKTNAKVINLYANTPYNDYGHSLASCPNRNQAHATLSESNKYGITSLGSGTWSGSWNATTMSGDLVYLWDGTVASPFTFARKADVESAMTGFDVSYGSISHVGNDFLTWLRGCATDHTYDARDLARGNGDWWPGAYQGGPTRAAEVEPFDPLTPIDF
ncbi:MAG: hypothetical protein J6Y32_01345, partial [Bacteroidales bacterium]|nr:hypothetical protein [Bacteroidales bacterium]